MLDPETGKYTNYSLKPGKANYDIAADKEDKVWVSQPGGNDMVVVDSHSGKIDQLALSYLASKDYKVVDLKFLSVNCYQNSMKADTPHGSQLVQGLH